MTETHYPINCNGFRTAKVNPDIGFLGEQKARLAERPLFIHAQKQATREAYRNLTHNRVVKAIDTRTPPNTYHFDSEGEEGTGPKPCGRCERTGTVLSDYDYIEIQKGKHKHFVIGGCPEATKQLHLEHEEAEEKAARLELEEQNELPGIMPIISKECQEDLHEQCQYATLKKTSTERYIQKCTCTCKTHYEKYDSDLSVLDISLLNARVAKGGNTKGKTKGSRKK